MNDEGQSNHRLGSLEERMKRLESQVAQLSRDSAAQGAIVPLIHTDLKGIRDAVQELATKMAGSQASAKMLLLMLTTAASAIGAGFTLLFKRVFAF